ncbi:hypothetical protein N7495_006855 [Penicillium taxi]|uniref:uncharacterized protein n=1 Tax=Penicillium taxi TaxID=168475 RepID=UPI0025452935|nr:uncharacterized protein N7495_006855 [Penicillium taxi]KAJ5895164.1 hypothetical protein N7495_006855 [Penicillium taxi]
MSILQFRDRRLASSTTASIYHHDPLLVLERQSKYIQQNLQALIDAQSEGLLSGLAKPEVDDTSEGSYTPTSSRPQSSSPVAQHPTPKRIGLRSARKGIFQSIYDLLKVREQERDILSSQADERNIALHDIEEFTSRRSGLENAIYGIKNEGGNKRAKQLQQEAQGLETDIKNLETKLYELKARHRHLVREASKIENTVDAKLSSYIDSLSLLQSEIQTYLRHPPVQPLSRRGNANESTFYSLNPKRRTLEMAQDHWKEDQETLQDRRRVVDAEILALEEGGGVWKQTIADVNGFETRLSGYMRHFVQLEVQATKGEYIGRTKDEVAASIWQDLEQTTQRLETSLELAEDKDWKLLVCCIAAELEALREARGMLLPAFGLSVAEDEDIQNKEESTDIRRQYLETDDLEPPADLLRDGDDHRTDTASRSEDDEPDPAWLLPP